MVGRLRQHVDGCARCQKELEQLRQAEAWLLAQPVEAPPMIAAQAAAWAAIQARIAAVDAPVPTTEKALSNGHAPERCPAASPEADTLVPLVAASDDADAAEANRRYHPLPVPQPPAPVTITFPPFGKPGALRPYRVLIVALAASFIVGSFAALFLVHLPPGGVLPVPTPPSLLSMDVLDPGSETPAFSFDPVSRRLFALTGEMRYGCLPQEHCPNPGPACLHFAMLDVDSGKALSTVRPTCTPGRSTFNSITFTDLLDDSATGEALLVGSNQQVTAVDNRSGAVVNKYALACCPNDYDQLPQTFLDQQDQLLLTTAVSGVAGVPDKVIAQSATTGQFKYQVTLEGTSMLRGALVSSVTNWLYVWNQCAMDSSASCVDAYQAGSGQKVTTWQAPSQETPLAADPTADVLYVRQNQPNGQSATLVVDGHSGTTVGQLPPAQAMAINAPLHHAYLLDDDGVTVVDTQTRRKLSTLPVLAHDETWAAPAVDAATSQVYLPIQRGKLLMAQDDGGQLHLRSAQLAAVLAAERTMTVDSQAKGDMALYPWELPVGPGSSLVYHPFSRGTQSGCGIGWVAARSAAAISSQGEGQYQVRISLAWDDQFAGGSLNNTPTPQSSYPHQHSWLYHVPASGAAWLSGEQGEGYSTNCLTAGR